MKNYGFIEPQIEDKAWLAGSLTGPVLVDDGQWDKYLPEIEKQNVNGIETWNCTSFGALNQLEAYLQRRFGSKTNKSDRRLGLLAGTTQGGNSPQTVYETMRTKGLCPDYLLPFDNTIQSWQEYYSMKGGTELACVRAEETWLKTMDVQHEWVFTKAGDHAHAMMDALRYSPLAVSVRAWELKDGLYVKPEAGDSNHWCMLYGYEEGKFWKVYDSYDNNFKKLAWDYKFDFCKRIQVDVAPVKVHYTDNPWLNTLITRCIPIIRIFMRSSQKLGALGFYPIPAWVRKYLSTLTPTKQLAMLAKLQLGADLSFYVDNSVGCAESASRIIREVHADFPIVTGTYTLYDKMKNDSRFARVQAPENGCIVIAVTGMGDGRIRNGHVGIYVDGRVYSNNSVSGKFDNHFSLLTFKTYFNGKGGFPILYYKLVK